MPQLNGRQRLHVRRALKKHTEAQGDEALVRGELSIVPLLDVITNLTVFLLATASMVSMTSEVAVATPSACHGRCVEPPPSLDLTVVVSAATIRVAGSHGQLAPGCATTSEGAATIVRDGHEWDALRDCARRLHDTFPREDEVRLTADPLVPYEDTIAAMDALRGDDEGPLFPEIRLAAGIR